MTQANSVQPNTADASRNTTIWTRGFFVAFLCNTTMQMSQNMMNTLVPRYVNSLGAAAAVVGLIGGVFAATALLVRPVSGPAVDYFNKKTLYTIAIGILAVAYLGFAVSKSVPMVVAARLLQGVSMGFTGPLGMALASESLPVEKMASGIGIYSLAQSVGQALGPTVGLSLVEMFGYNTTFSICVGIACIAIALSFFAVTKTPENRGKFTISLEKIAAREAVVPTIILFFFSFGWIAISSFIVIFGESQGVEGMGLFFTVYAIVLLLTRPLFGRIADEQGIGSVIVPSSICYALSFVLMGLSHSLISFLIAAALAAFGYGGAQPALQALCMSAVPLERRGAGANTAFIGIDGGQLVGGYVAGMIAQLGMSLYGSTADGYSFMYMTMIIPCILVLVVYWFSRNELKALEANK